MCPFDSFLIYDLQEFIVDTPDDIMLPTEEYDPEHLEELMAVDDCGQEDTDWTHYEENTRDLTDIMDCNTDTAHR